MRFQDPINLLKKAQFGDIDGLYDPKISEYFIDYEFKNALLVKPIYFIVGRKGTGKSALYNWIHKNQVENHNLIANLSFNNFPFEKLLSLSDDNFTRPNQYQSIWRNIIYAEIAGLLVKDESNIVDNNLKELKDYTLHFFGENLEGLYKQVTKTTKKTDRGLALQAAGFQGSLSNGTFTESRRSEALENLSKINARLEKLIRDYLIVHANKQYLIQFDQLDDNYTRFVNDSTYTQCIISLFKSIYDINQKFRSESIPVKAVAYLRSDIYNNIDQFDAESARWDQYKLNLNWAVINRDDWQNPKLLQIVNKRIELSVPEIINSHPFGVIFDNNLIKMQENDRDVDVFKFIVHRTFQRPRDVIQFCIKIQEESNSSNKLYYRTILNAEKQFSLWLLSEIENEIAPLITDVEALYELLRLMGANVYTVSDFKSRYSRFSTVLKMEAEDLLKLLYSFGIVFNINFKANGRPEYYSIIRNDKSVFNRDIKICTHLGFYKGLHTSKFFKR